MTRTSDVVIAGAGVIGLTIAWYLRARGATVTVLDAGCAGREASWAGGGILWPIYPWRYPASVRTLAERGAVLYPGLCVALADATGIDPEWRRTGALVLDRAERDAAVAWADDAGWRYEILTLRSLASRVPGVNADEGAVYLPEVAQIRNPRLCRALVTALRADGMRVLEYSRVHEVVSENGRFAGFRTADGVIEGNSGVIAAGAWSGGIAGVPGLPAVAPVKGQMLLLAGRSGRLPHVLVRRGRYAIPRSDGRVLVGSTVEQAGFDQVPTRAGSDQLHATAASLAPMLADFKPEAHWTGLRPATPDGEPFMGAVPGIDGLFASIGHYRNGLAHAPAAAEMLAKRIAEG